jgi:hypothetical protein
VERVARLPSCIQYPVSSPLSWYDRDIQWDTLLTTRDAGRGMLSPSATFQLFEEGFPVNNRTLGTLAMICAPAMLVEALVPGGSELPIVVGTASMVFMAGSLCSQIGLWRVAATGTHWWGRAVLGIQIALVSLAFLFGLFEATSLVGEENLLFIITDMAWPISMLFMLVVGITAAVVGRLAGWRRFVPLLCGLAFPLSILLTMVGGLDMQSDAVGLIFFSMLAAFWMLLGFVVRETEAARAAATAQAHSLA